MAEDVKPLDQWLQNAEIGNHLGVPEIIVSDFITSFLWLKEAAWQHAESRGFHDKQRSEKPFLAKFATLLLMVTEIAEAAEGIRDKDQQSEKIPMFSKEEEELGDLLVRMMDYSHEQNIRLVEAALHKMVYNMRRPHGHGGKAV